MLPNQFLEQIHRLSQTARGIAPKWGDALTDLPRVLSHTEPTTSVRINRSKPTAKFSENRQVEWCNLGYRLDERPAFIFDPQLHQGRYYVQDASSMFIAHAIKHLTANRTTEALRYLDACAAPGGKTTAAADALPEGSLIVANEFVAARAAILRENCAKWGNPNIVVTGGDTSMFAQEGAVFDIIAADVPCSGEGMMRKDAQAVEQWTPQLVEQCAERQRQIIDNLWPALAPGGYLIYSTCTFNLAENEAMVSYILNRYKGLSVEIPTPEQWNLMPSLDPQVKAWRFVPGAVEGEGLFMAVVQKPIDAEAVQSKKSKKSSQKNPSKAVAPAVASMLRTVNKWIDSPVDYSLQVNAAGDGINLLLSSQWPDHPYQPSIPVATIKGSQPVPTQNLALSTVLRADAFEQVEIDLDQAIDYLRTEAITLPEGTPRGIVLLTFDKTPLGFVKNIGNRANNLYPKAWRILSQPR